MKLPRRPEGSLSFDSAASAVLERVAERAPEGDTFPSLSYLVRRRAKRGRSQLADWDLFVLLALVLADVRVFRGGAVGSFTLFELFVWGYCTPIIVGHLLASRPIVSSAGAQFISTVLLYLAWLLFVSLVAMIAREHSDVLQQAKNIFPALPLVCFISIRLRRTATVARLANLYLLYCIAACVLAVLQFKYGGPYFQSGPEGNQYKLDFSGEVVSNVVLGLSSTPNGLAITVLPGVMFSAIKLTYELRNDRRPWLMTLACCAVTGTVFLLSQGRGAVIWFLFGFAFMVCPTRRSSSFTLKLALVACLIVVIIVYGMRVNSEDLDVGNTMVTRFLLWKTSLSAIAGDAYVALIGDGMGYVRTWSWSTAGWEFPDAHNGWIDEALFFGLPAVLLYLAIWWRFFAITDAAAKDNSCSPLVAALLDAIRASVLALMGLSFFEPVASSVFPVSQLFLLMSCGVTLAGLSAKAERPGLTVLPRVKCVTLPEVDDKADGQPTPSA